LKYKKDEKYYVILDHNIFGERFYNSIYEAYYVRKGMKDVYYIFYVPYIGIEFPFSEEEILESSSLLNELV
jgi:hypothetical protein